MELLENELPMVLKVLSRATSVLGVGGNGPDVSKGILPCAFQGTPTWENLEVLQGLLVPQRRECEEAPRRGDHEMESMRQLLEGTSGTLLECIDAELDAPEACACRDRMEWK